MMKRNSTILMSALALAASAVVAMAQAPGGAGEQGAAGGQGGPGGPGGPRPHMVPPIIAALDANHDGVIDADEIANAPAALKTLDKNGDGKLTRDEIHPPRPPGEEPGGRPPKGAKGHKGGKNPDTGAPEQN